MKLPEGSRVYVRAKQAIQSNWWYLGDGRSSIYQPFNFVENGEVQRMFCHCIQVHNLVVKPKSHRSYTHPLLGAKKWKPNELRMFIGGFYHITKTHMGLIPSDPHETDFRRRGAWPPRNSVGFCSRDFTQCIMVLSFTCDFIPLHLPSFRSGFNMNEGKDVRSWSHES